MCLFHAWNEHVKVKRDEWEAEGYFVAMAKGEKCPKYERKLIIRTAKVEDFLASGN